MPLPGGGGAAAPGGVQVHIFWGMGGGHPGGILKCDLVETRYRMSCDVLFMLLLASWRLIGNKPMSLAVYWFVLFPSPLHLA